MNWCITGGAPALCGDGSGVFACRCRFGEPEFIRRIAADPGTLDAQLTIASSVTREYVDWPEKRAGKKMISERSRASDPKGVKRGKQCANATGSVAAHASHVRGVEAPRGLTCEFSFDKKGRPTLCHVLT